MWNVITFSNNELISNEFPSPAQFHENSTWSPLLRPVSTAFWFRARLNKPFYLEPDVCISKWRRLVEASRNKWLASCILFKMASILKIWAYQGHKHSIMLIRTCFPEFWFSPGIKTRHKLNRIRSHSTLSKSKWKQKICALGATKLHSCKHHHLNFYICYVYI